MNRDIAGEHNGRKMSRMGGSVKTGKQGSKRKRSAQVLKHPFAWFASLLIVIVIVFAPPLAAQDSPVFNEPFSTWDKTAAEAQRLLELDSPTESVLEQLRKTLALQRDAAFDLSEKGSLAARALQAQLDALGPPPPEGETEAEEIAERRLEIKKQLSTANAPILAAQEAFERAQFLVREMDTKLRASQTAKMLRQ